MHYYEPSGRRVLFFVFGAFLTFSVSSGVIYHLLSGGPGLNAYVWLFSSGVLWCGIWLMATSLRFRLTLKPRLITVRRAFRTSTVARRDIASYSPITISNRRGGASHYLYLYTRGKHLPCLIVPFDLEDTSPVMAWMEGIPHSTSKDAKRRRSQR